MSRENNCRSRLLAGCREQVTACTFDRKFFCFKTPAAELARAELRGGAFRGWLVVAGSIEISGDARVRGLVYAQDGFAYRGATPGGIEGQVVAAGVHGGSASLSTTGGSTTLTFDCAAASGGDGTVPRSWILKAGSYREPSDP